MDEVRGGLISANIPPIEDLGGVFAEYAEQVRRGTGVDPKKVSYDDPRFKLYNDLQSDAARFAAFREAQKQLELDAAPDATEKAKVEARYKEYLKTEKQGIFANSAAAERWAGFEENADLYPNLEWRTAGDSDVRPEHARLDGLTLPINDPFWKRHTPPLGFGCRCELIQTDKKVTKNEGYDQTTASKGFDFNPGKDHKVFSETAGYYTSASKEESEKLTREAANFVANVSKQAVLEYMKKQSVKLSIGKKAVTLSNRDLKTIVNKPHADRVMRNTLLYDLKNVMKDAKLIYSTPENKGREQYVKWLYYSVKGFENMFLNVVEMKNGEVKLHAITDKIQGK